MIVFALASILLVSFGYWYVYGVIVKQAENYSSAQQQIELEKGRAQREQELAKTYNDTLNDRMRLPVLIISDDKVVNFIEAIESITNLSSADVALSSIINANSHLKGVVEIKGTWANVMKALILIENLPYSISFDTLKMSLDDKKWSIVLDIRALTTTK